MKKYAILLFVFLFAAVSYASAETPMQTVEKCVNDVLSVLKEGSKNDKSILEKKKDQIRAISNRFFDYIELSRRTLGMNWNKFTVPQRKEFVPLYEDLLEGVYMDRILAYKDEKVEYSKQIMFSDTQAEVRTKVLAKTGPIPINYRLLLKNGQWRVYDVTIEGVSLVSNYRSQFNSMLQKKTPEQLLETLRKKVKS
jgi:phospholipid transport system substrate-binding protein